ncbi:adrenocortical dysplasia protein homolog isoform X2 [Hyperolius riggenbachi]|uniref:adrenocortical dysplasia protein homolog isoform X2 n=1 Tax=Hyperolius riggenbachi TaxID=752182 RepID=UPI0035A2DB4D
MKTHRSTVGYPWIIDAIAKYKGEPFTPKAVPAQVVEFLKMPERSNDCRFPGAVLHISDPKHYIRAIITREAEETLDREDGHFTLAHIKNKIIILKKFTLSFEANEDPRFCEFYLTIQHFCVVPMEASPVDLLNCNADPGVRNKMKELWQRHMEELKVQQAVSEMNSSDVSLTQLLMIANEEKLNELKAIAEQCLDLDPFVTQDISPQARTTWRTEMQHNKDGTSSFSVPIKVLLIPPEEEAALEQMSAFRPDVNSSSDEDDYSSAGENCSPVYSTARSSLSSDPVDEAESQLGNPWDNLPSLCALSASGPIYSSAVSSSPSKPVADAESQPGNPWDNLPSVCALSASVCSISVAHQNCGKDLGADSDVTPDGLNGPEDKCMNDSHKTQDELPSFCERLSNSAILQPDDSTIGHMTTVASSNGDATSSQERQSDSSPSLLALVPLAVNQGNNCSREIHSSPQKTVVPENKVQASFMLPGSESEGKTGIVRKVSSPKLVRNRESCLPSTTKKAVKRKHVPDDLEFTSPDLEHALTVCTSRQNCVPSGPVSEKSTPVPDTNKEIQCEVTKVTEESSITGLDSRMELDQRRTEQDNHVPPNTHEITVPTKKALRYKPSLEFVVNSKPKAANNCESAAPATDSPTSRLYTEGASSTGNQEATFKVPVGRAKRAKMVHHDGRPFQYRYPPPSPELCASVKSLNPTERGKSDIMQRAGQP